MGRKWAPDDIPDSVQLPDQTYHFKVEEIEETETAGRDGKAKKLMYVAHMVVLAPKQYKGLKFNDNFVIGSDEDPKAKDPDTWKAAIGSRRMKDLFKAAKVTLKPDLDACREECEGNEVVADVVLQPDRKDKTRMNNNVTKYHKVGEKEPGGAKEGASTGPKKIAQPPVEGEGEETPTPASTVKKAKKLPPPPPPDDDDLDDDDEDDDD